MVVTVMRDSTMAVLHLEETRYDVVILGKEHVALVPKLDNSSCVVLCRSYVESRQKGAHYLPLPLRYTKLYLLVVTNVFLLT
jgi:hypothetical protein